MAAAIVVLAPGSASAMHIAEGILPAKWAGLWYVVAAPFLAWGLWDIKRRSEADPRYKAFVALVGAAVFIISCMPIPVPVAGSCSHPCGTGLAAILIGPGPAVVVTTIALALQALFMAHGGLSTLGANVVSMGVLGAFSGYAVWRIGRKIGLPVMVAAFAAGMIADWATYAGTSFELASALHADRSLWVLFATLLVAFMPTQIPLGLFEGALTAGAYSFVNARRPELLDHRLVKPATASKA
jgi:cobalt/nickel transport system permease protein